MRKWFLALSAVLLVLLLANAASADPLVGQTALTIHQNPPGRVGTGDTVTIFGRLVGRPECRGGQPISLLELGVGTVATTTTDGSGNYSFSRTVTATTSFQTRFDGATIGTHPNEFLCAASVSPVLKVKVIGTHVLAAEGSRGPTATSAAFTGSNLAAVAVILVALLLAGAVALTLSRRSSHGGASPPI